MYRCRSPISRITTSYMSLDNSNRANSDVFLVTELCPQLQEDDRSHYLQRQQKRQEGGKEMNPLQSKLYKEDNQPSFHTTPTPFPNGASGTCSINKDGSSSCGSGVNPLVFDPRTNLREAAKNMLLLEDHLLQEGMDCKDCISKHLLMVDAYLSEALSLDTTNQYTEKILGSLKQMRDVMKQINDSYANGSAPDRTSRSRFSQQIRMIRKPLCQEFACFVG